MVVGPGEMPRADFRQDFWCAPKTWKICHELQEIRDSVWGLGEVVGDVRLRCVGSVFERPAGKMDGVRLRS